MLEEPDVEAGRAPTAVIILAITMIETSRMIKSWKMR